MRAGKLAAAATAFAKLAKSVGDPVSRHHAQNARRRAT
jgi:hypothetical protein